MPPGDCTLREAMVLRIGARRSSLPASEYVLFGASCVVGAAVTIRGAGVQPATIRQSAQRRRAG